jgi:D-alanyl-D-alanine carboxypeptidase (penicillin-binding protein 5/6)
MMRKNEKQENPMPNDLPTDRLPTMAETRAMHEQAVRARKKQRLKKTLITIAVTLLVITLLAALALFVRAKLQTLDKPLDAKTNQTAQTQPQEPSIEPDSQASEQPEPETPAAEPEADTLPESETEPAQDLPEESEPEETPASEASSEKTYAPAEVTENTKTLDLELYSENALLIDLESNTVLVQKNADARIYPASMTKVMTVLVAAEHIENWDETFTMTQSIIDPLFLADASMAGFVHGEEVSMTELLYGAVLPSGAEATEALAIVTAGSEEAFAALMNEKAQELGLKDTHFVDASGLHDENHYTTLSDMAIILQAALDNPHCREVLTSVNHTSPATAQNPEGVAMTNRFLYRIRPQQTGNVDIQAAKTGYTAQAMNCCVSYGIMENGRAAICVTAHAWTGDYCIADHLALYGTYCGT